MNKNEVQNGVKYVSLLGITLYSPTKRVNCRHLICTTINFYFIKHKQINKDKEQKKKELGYQKE